MEGIAASSLLGARGNQALIAAIQELNTIATLQLQSLQKPFIFLKSNNNNLSSAVTDGVIILAGPLIREGQKGVVEDFNINFTTAAGTIRFVIVDAQKNILVDILRDITASTNGTGKTVLDPNQRLAIVGQTSGAGTFSVYCSGFVQQVIV